MKQIIPVKLGDNITLTINGLGSTVKALASTRALRFSLRAHCRRKRYA